MECKRAEEEAEAAANEAKMDAGETLAGDAPEKVDVEHNLRDRPSPTWLCYCGRQ